jgi:transcriptional regulator with XRE-family HTH domain
MKPLELHLASVADIIGKNLKRIRTARNLSQDDLASKIEVDPGSPPVNRVTISGLENGRGGLSEKMIARICAALEVDQEALLATRAPDPTDSAGLLRQAMGLLSTLDDDGLEAFLTTFGRRGAARSASGNSK